ncbi:hypothetical protein HYX03_01495 [Candidatus Woesearchaeota archaeon]|nr:hypothetical protein [Candidatus Woesearchaeota archaeon]
MQKRGFFKFSNKKGSLITRENLMHLGMIGILAMVFFILLAYVDTVKKDTQFEMLFLSRDLALLTNTIHSATGDVEYTYVPKEVGLNIFNFEFKALSNNDNPIVEVSHEGISKNYPYGRPSQIKDEYLLSGAKSIKFSKSDTKLAINKNE